MKNLQVRLHAFGTACRIVVGDDADRGEQWLELARSEIQRLDAKFSAFEPESLISQINRAAGSGSVVTVDAESRSLFDYVGALWGESNHLFDPSVRLLHSCYDSKGKLLASQEQLKDMMKLVDWSKLQVTPEGASLIQDGMLIDLNSCIRPYTADSVIKLLKKQGARSALVELGQDNASIGKQPDNANWLIGFRFPSGSRTGITRLKLNDRGFAIRGDFERAVKNDGERFGRALSPVDGLPIPGLLSVAVIADNCLTACSVASVARTRTEAAGLKWLEKLGFPWMAIDRELNCHGPLAPKA